MQWLLVCCKDKRRICAPWAVRALGQFPPLCNTWSKAAKAGQVLTSVTGQWTKINLIKRLGCNSAAMATAAGSSQNRRHRQRRIGFSWAAGAPELKCAVQGNPRCVLLHARWREWCFLTWHPQLSSWCIAIPPRQMVAQPRAVAPKPGRRVKAPAWWRIDGQSTKSAMSMDPPPSHSQPSAWNALAA